MISWHWCLHWWGGKLYILDALHGALAGECCVNAAIYRSGAECHWNLGSPLIQSILQPTHAQHSCTSACHKGRKQTPRGAAQESAIPHDELRLQGPNPLNGRCRNPGLSMPAIVFGSLAGPTVWHDVHRIIPCKVSLCNTISRGFVSGAGLRCSCCNTAKAFDRTPAGPARTASIASG